VLNQSDVVPYLLKRKLISTKLIVESDLLVKDISGRNHNYAIISEHGQSYLLKQGVDQERKVTIAHEAAMYKLFQEEPTLKSKLPRSYGYDPEEHILILELLRDGQSLREYHAIRSCLSLPLARTLGEALATLHRVTKTAGKRYEDAYRLYDQPPWILSIHRTALHVFQQASRANMQLIQRIQSTPEIGRHFDALRRNWTAEALIHFDMKWDNCIAFARPGSQRKTRLYIVDWELADWGDPCWDIASVFSDYLNFWVFSMPITSEMPAEQAFELARCPLESIQQGIQAFWQRYVKRMELSRETADVWLMRTLGYTAAKLVQTAFERTQLSQQLTSGVESLLHLSSHIVQQPLEMVVDLLGFPLQQLHVI